MGDRVPVESVHLALHGQVLIDPRSRVIKVKGRIERGKPVEGFLLIVLSFVGVDDIFDHRVALGLEIVSPITVGTSKPNTLAIFWRDGLYNILKGGMIDSHDVNKMGLEVGTRRGRSVFGTNCQTV